MKTKEELNALKNEVEAVSKKLAELSEEELAEIVGGREDLTIKPKDGEFWHSWNPSPVISDEPLK